MMRVSFNVYLHHISITSGLFERTLMIWISNFWESPTENGS